MERRQFILSSAGALGCAGLSTAVAQTSAKAPGAAGFAALVGDWFNVYDSVRGVTVQLLKVKQAKASPGTEQFSLSFSGSGGGALDSGTYEVEHAHTGKLLMYLVAHKAGKNMLYRADFNLLA
jgi:hypothetical protein